MVDITGVKRHMNWDTLLGCGTISGMMRTSCRGVQDEIVYLRAMLHFWLFIPTSIPISQLKRDRAPTIELISPHTYPVGSQSIPVRLKISDSGGLHWVILFIGGDATKAPEVKACHGLAGKKEAVIEFDYDGVIPSNGSTNLSSPLVHPIRVEAIDTDGDVGRARFVLFSETLQPLSKISGDNQHGLPNTRLPVPFGR